MFRKSVVLVILLLVPAVAYAMPRGCSALAAGGKDLWIIEAGQAPRRVLSAEQDIAAGSWSPDGRRVAFSGWLPSTDVGTEVVFADTSGRILGRFKVDKPQEELPVRYFGGIEWRGPWTLVTDGSRGPHGGCMDVWRLARDYSGAERVRRAGYLGGGCTISPSMQYVACVDEENGISIFDTLGPVDEDGEVFNDPVFGTPSSGGGWENPSEGVESNLVWDAAGTLYAVQSLSSKRVLTTIEQSASAAGGWRITDRDLVGVDSPVRSIEVEAGGGLLLSDGRRVFHVDTEPEAPRSGLVARVASAGELRRPGSVEVATEHGTRPMKVLDTYCEDSALRD